MSSRLVIMQRNSPQAAKLNRILKDFYVKNIQGKPVANIREQTINELDSILSFFMIQSYQAQADSINKRFKALPYYSLGQEDQTAINNAIRIIEDKFYFKVKQVETRNQGIEFGDVTDISLTVRGVVEKNPLDMLVYINGVASGVVFGATNLANRTVPPVIINKVPPKKADEILKWRWRYVTKNDDKVCDNWERACRPLEGKIFEIGDPNTPNPPYDRHVHCRCTMVLFK